MHIFILFMLMIILILIVGVSIAILGLSGEMPLLGVIAALIMCFAVINIFYKLLLESGVIPLFLESLKHALKIAFF